MLARKLENPDIKWGSKHSIKEVPARLAILQGLYNRGELQLVPKFTRAGERKGFKIKVGTGVRVSQVRAALNGIKGEDDIGSDATVTRWMEDGCPGLRMRGEETDSGEAA